SSSHHPEHVRLFLAIRRRSVLPLSLVRFVPLARRRWRTVMSRKSITLISMATLALVACGSVAVLADDDRVVKGTVRLPSENGQARDVVIYLEGRIGAPAPRKAVIDQKEMTFVPHVVGVTAGSAVGFLNSDPVPHNVFSTSTAKHFDLGVFTRGESRAVTFNTPGGVELRCNVHPKMRAFVVVLENNYFAMPDEQGNFQISGIPAGRYKLRAWHEGLPPAETWVNLDDAKLRDVELRLQK